ncbi:hypothetical protein F441_02282 [Phytophthora nicotianae CJ01A1]|uniref:Uncharacterized protein n=3 Tax=Phytophthora nicotianae TaxID=4792 RepID=W3A2L3_PHYNI|nr:hypothetical protein L917_02106 [Phytophthora nicotianae]ETP24776.1 hypothetical protein F441_02282 [Phytophthora nicotianae CJ01A1]ETP52759.1 hypothetical protein F442_02275 [Phytophthora nicotianae P10297]
MSKERDWLNDIVEERRNLYTPILVRIHYQDKWMPTSDN